MVCIIQTKGRMYVSLGNGSRNKVQEAISHINEGGFKIFAKQLLGSSLEKGFYELISIFIECAVLFMQQVNSIKLIIFF